MTTSFKWDVGRKFLIRRDHGEYADGLGDPHWNRGYTNEALVVIYRNIEHVESSYFGYGFGPIHFEPIPAGLTNTVQFVNDQNGWVTRETYSLADSTNLTVTFEYKDQGTDNFQTMASGVLHKE